MVMIFWAGVSSDAQASGTSVQKDALIIGGVSTSEDVFVHFKMGSFIYCCLELILVLVC